MGKGAEYGRRKRAYLRRIINAVKSVPCADCSADPESVILTFDHLPEFEKKGDINNFVKNRSRRGLLNEMAKCDVVCRPCHDIRELKRRGMFIKPIIELKECKKINDE